MWDTLVTYAQNNEGGSSMFTTLVWVATIAGLWKMFEKAGEPGWAGIIPFYNQYKLCEKVMANPWYWLRLFILCVPIIGWFGFFYFQYQIGKATARAYGQPDSYAWGYTFIPAVFYCITGFGNYDYYGPYGEGDMRTRDARQARTVDFDVIKEAPAARPAAEPVVEEVKPAKAESEVEFDFNQDDVIE